MTFRSAAGTARKATTLAASSRHNRGTFPVITFLSQSPRQSRQTQSYLHELFSMEPLVLSSQAEFSAADHNNSFKTKNDTNIFHSKNGAGDELDKTLRTFSHQRTLDDQSGKILKWDSSSSFCPNSRTVLHFLSLSSPSSNSKSFEHSSADLEKIDTSSCSSNSENELSILSITKGSAESVENHSELSFKMNAHNAVLRSREILARNILQTSSPGNDGNNKLSFWSNLRKWTSGKILVTKLRLFKNVLNMKLSPSHFLPLNSGVGGMLLDLPPATSKSRSTAALTDQKNCASNSRATANINHDSKNGASSPQRLREIVLPHFGSESVNSATLLTYLSKSGLSPPRHKHNQRSITGLFQWPSDNFSGIVIRPLPAATEDHGLSPPTLVFQCDDLEQSTNHFCEKLQSMQQNDSSLKSSDSGAINVHKIGFSGGNCNKKGQLVLSKHPAFGGVDIRLCQCQNLSSSFAESTESLLAGSLDELQSASVMREGSGGSNHGTSIPRVQNGQQQKQINGNDDIAITQHHSSPTFKDEKTNQGDCWVEFRANVRKPSGFGKGFGKQIQTWMAGGAKKLKANAPNIPYQ